MCMCRFYGTRSLKVALNHHLVARTHSCKGDFRSALQSEKEAYAIYKQLVCPVFFRPRVVSGAVRLEVVKAVPNQGVNCFVS